MSAHPSAPTDPIYYENIRVLWAGQRYKEVWPSPDMSTSERVNAMVRFCGYAGVALYTARHGDDRFLLYSLTAIAIVTLAYRFSRQKAAAESFEPGTQPFEPGTQWEQADEPESISADRGGKLCQPPTRNNPFGNLLLTDITDNPNRPPACKYDDVKGDINRVFDKQVYRDVDDVYNNAGRNFYSMPSTTLVSDRKAFTDFAYKDFQKSAKNRYVNPW